MLMFYVTKMSYFVMEKPVKPNVWDSSQKIHSETQINSQSEEHSSDLFSAQYNK